MSMRLITYIDLVILETKTLELETRNSALAWNRCLRLEIPHFLCIDGVMVMQCCKLLSYLFNGRSRLPCNGDAWNDNKKKEPCEYRRKLESRKIVGKFTLLSNAL